MTELREEHEVALRLSANHAPELLLEMFRDASDQPRYLSLEWAHEFTSFGAWRVAVALFAERLKHHEVSSPVHWLVHSAAGHQTGALTQDELLVEAEGNTKTLRNPRVAINHLSAWCDDVLIEMDIPTPGRGVSGKINLLWPEGHLLEAEVSLFLERCGQFSADAAATAMASIIEHAYPKV